MSGAVSVAVMAQHRFADKLVIELRDQVKDAATPSAAPLMLTDGEEGDACAHALHTLNCKSAL